MADRRSDDIPDKPAADHDENAIVQEDEDMTPWQCVVANPKVVLWTLFANGQLAAPAPAPAKYSSSASWISHGGIREPQPVHLPRNAGVPVSDDNRRLAHSCSRQSPPLT